MLEHVFSFHRTTKNISKEIVNFLLKLSFNEVGGLSIFHHVSQFNLICNALYICNENDICKLFTLTLHGRMRS